MNQLYIFVVAASDGTEWAESMPAESETEAAFDIEQRHRGAVDVLEPMTGPCIDETLPEMTLRRLKRLRESDPDEAFDLLFERWYDGA